MTVVFGLRKKLRVRMRTTLENGVLRNRGRAENSSIDRAAERMGGAQGKYKKRGS